MTVRASQGVSSRFISFGFEDGCRADVCSRLRSCFVRLSGAWAGAHPLPPLASNYLPHFWFFRKVDWTLIHHFVDRTRIHSTSSGGSLETFLVFHGGCQTGFRQCERQGMCIVCELALSRAVCVCVEAGICILERLHRQIYMSSRGRMDSLLGIRQRKPKQCSRETYLPWQCLDI